MNWGQTWEGAAPITSEQPKTTHTLTQSQPAAIALKLCLHGRTGNSLMFVCVPVRACAQWAALQRLNKRNIPLYTNAIHTE